MDLISRKAAIDALTRKMVSIPTAGEKDLMGNVNRIRAEDISVIRRLPSAQPEMNLDEWCTDCKEYDHERNCCPRWNRVIRTTLKDMPEIIRCKDCAKREFCRTSTVWAVRPGDDWFCADAERKKGNWIDKGWNGDWQYQMDGRGMSWHEWQCSECNHITKGAKWNFCPNCGADMREDGAE